MAKLTAKSDSGKSGSPKAVALWIYNPWLDLLVGCGAWSAPLLLFAYFADSTALAWSVAFYGLALFFNYPHYMATLYRAYHTSEDFHKYRIFTVHITAVLALTLLVSHFWYRALPWIFTLYLTWSPWHYSGQNYGLFMMFARRAGAKPSDGERRALYSIFLISYLVIFLSFHTGPSSDPLFVSLGFSGRVSSLILIMLAVAFVVLSAYALPRLAQQAGWRQLLPALTLYSTQFVWFLLPTALTLGEGMRITQSRYSNGVLAVMHSAQYLWITSYYARREATAEAGGRWRPFGYFAVLVAGGIALFVPGPWLASRVFHHDFTASFLLFTALVNIHHFILDGAIWKLRDGRIAALLLNSREQVVSATSEAGSHLAAGVRWIVGDSPISQGLRISAALLLLAWGTLDQARYYFVLHGDSLAYLQRAAVLDSFDSSLQMRLGRKELEAGQAENAVAAWRQAVRTAPADPGPRDLLLKYLTNQRRFDEAYVLTAQSLRYTPKDVNLLVNHGILAQQLGHSNEAVESWQKAVSFDPAQSSAHLYLAGELDREGKPEAAIPQYLAFLQQMTKAGAQNRLPADKVIAVVLRLAQCQERANHLDQAEKSYQLAQGLASESGQARLESIVSVNQAQLEARQNKVDAALRLYQHALTLDSRLNDSRSEAADWYSYGVFLRNSGFPPRLAYACLVKAELLIQPFENESQLNAIAAARDRLDKGVGAQAGRIQRDPQAALDEALKLKSRE
jgi:tetratricopeptide (TPR) repeat protein